MSKRLNPMGLASLPRGPLVAVETTLLLLLLLPAAALVYGERIMN